MICLFAFYLKPRRHLARPILASFHYRGTLPSPSNPLHISVTVQPPDPSRLKANSLMPVLVTVQAAVSWAWGFTQRPVWASAGATARPSRRRRRAQTSDSHRSVIPFPWRTGHEHVELPRDARRPSETRVAVDLGPAGFEDSDSGWPRRATRDRRGDCAGFRVHRITP